MITNRKASESERFSTFLGWIALLFHGFLSKTCKQGDTYANSLCPVPCSSRLKLEWDPPFGNIKVLLLCE
jgi:hypothetical protein